MYESLDLVQWQTCVVCWRAWYEVPRAYQLQPPSSTDRGTKTWFDFHRSSILGASRRKDVDHWYLQADDRTSTSAAAKAYLRRNYPEDMHQRLLDRLVDPRSKRDIVI